MPLSIAVPVDEFTVWLSRLVHKKSTWLELNMACIWATCAMVQLPQSAEAEHIDIMR